MTALRFTFVFPERYAAMAERMSHNERIALAMLLLRAGEGILKWEMPE